MNTLAPIILFACIAGNMAFKVPDMTTPAAKEAFLTCAKENNVDLTTFAKMDPNVDKPDFKMMEANKCFFKCLLLRQGLINDKGEFNIDKLKSYFELKDEDDMIKHTKECAASVKETDPCERVLQVSKCAHEKDTQ